MQTVYTSLYLSMVLQPFVGPWPLFQFLNLYTVSKGSFDGGSARRKAATYTQKNTNTEYTRTDIHVSSGIRTHDPSVTAAEDGSCLRPRGHCDRHILIYRRKNRNWNNLNQIGESPGPAPSRNSADGDVVTLETTVQEITAALKSAETEDERSTVIMKAVCGIVMSKQGLALAVLRTYRHIWEHCALHDIVWSELDTNTARCGRCYHCITWRLSIVVTWVLTQAEL
jgi:hypothetical protein